MPGLSIAGLEIATLADVRAQINAAWLTAFGSSMNVTDRSPDGQLIGIFAELFAAFWELLDAVNSSQDIDKALGAFLRALCALTGTLPSSATFSTVTETLTGTPTTVIQDGSLIATTSTGQQFTTQGAGPVTIVAATAWAASTAYVVGDRRTNAGNIYLCTIAVGTSASSGGPTGTTIGVDIVDSGITWRFLGKGTGFVDVAMRAVTSGSVVAVAGDLNTAGISTPVGGWSGALNILDAVPGSPATTDAQLRVLQAQELAQPGTGPADAIRAALLLVGQGTNNPVTAATVFQNNTDTTDGNGVPPHSVEALVDGGLDQDIFDTLRVNVVGGIRTHGTVVGASIDSAGVSQVMKFSRTTQVLIYVGCTLIVDASVYPADGNAQVALAIATGGNAKGSGVDVVSAKLISLIDSVPGVLDIQLPLIGIAPSPTLTTTIAIGTRSRAVYDTGRVTVATSPGVP